MNITKKWGRIALLFVWVAVIASGCVGGGSATTLGWTVTAADATVVVGVFPSGLVVALDPNAGGAELWSFPPASQSSSSPFSCAGIGGATKSDTQKPFEAVYGPPVLTEDVVLFGSYDHSVYALDRDPAASITARIKWSYPTEGAIIGGVTLFDDGVYFASADDKVYAVSLAEGKSLWTAPFATQNAIWGAPAVDAERVYVGSMDHAVYALDRATGQQLWRTDVGGAVPGSVALSDGLVFASSLDKRLHVLKAVDGSPVWTSDELGSWLMGQPAVRDGYVYVGTLGGQLYGFDAESGESRWAAVELGSAVRASPAWVGDGLVVATEAGKLVTVAVETGAQTELYTATGSALAEPAVVDGVLYVGTTTGQVYALDPSVENAPLAWLYPKPAAK